MNRMGFFVWQIGRDYAPRQAWQCCARVDMLFAKGIRRAEDIDDRYLGYYRTTRSDYRRAIRLYDEYRERTGEPFLEAA